jgi:3-oxoadipate enol-lactonase
VTGGDPAREVKIAGGVLGYRREGEGPVVLFLHAFPLSLEMWDLQADALAGSHCVVRLDARGHGGSPPGDGILTMERYADDAVALLDELNVSQAVVCGCSMGGYAAFALARRHPGRMRGLVLADTRAEADSPEARTNRSLLAERVRREGVEAIVEAFLPRLLGATSQAERPEVVERVRGMMAATPVRGVIDALAGLGARGDSTPTLRQINVPTLVLCGDEDEITPPAGSRAMAAAIPGARLTLLPGAGHLANMEVPEAFNGELSAFLDGLPDEARPRQAGAVSS